MRFLLNNAKARQRWETTFAAADYGATLRRVCPPPVDSTAQPVPERTE